ncbi:cadherin domain-containing protein [Hymenobacter terricola]|uniref:cadherin domain-containing protein n=1 Tax=Hymenobacter terricola TaxID=2819236 RepID=UPI001B305C62|nr:cadherin domain-containing protein [Hymenobacter terricola]
MKTSLLLGALLLLHFGARAQTTLVQESFESISGNNGEGTRYTSNTFETTATQYFKRSGNPVVYPTGSTNQTFGSPISRSTILNVDGAGGQFWAAEGVRGTSATAPTAGLVPGTVTLNGLNVSSYTALKVRVAFADARGPGWAAYLPASTQARTTDHLRVQYSFDNSTFTTIGEFSGTSATGTSDWMKVGGTATDKLTTTLQDFEFPVNNVGTTLYVRVEADYSGSNKEIAFDNIRVLGTLNTVPLPTLAGIEPTAIAYAEGAPATQVTNTLVVANPNPPSGNTLTGATVRIQPGYVAGQDVLAFTAGNGITALSNAGGVLTLTGTASVTNYQAALRSVTYRNSDVNNATPGLRRLVFTAIDGPRSSATQSRDINVTASLNAPAPLPYTEDFEADAEGTRYGSNSFSANSQGFIRVTQNPPVLYSTTTYSGVQGSGYWYAEGTKDNITLGTLLLAPVNATNYHDLTFKLLLARGGTGGWTIDDYVRVSYNLNDGGGWHLFGAFYGIAATGALRQDANLDGVADAAGLALTSTMQDIINLSLPPTLTGGNINFKVEVANNGGEELAFDNIRITGISNRPPVIAAQSFSLAENSAAATVVGTVAASDPDAGQTLTYAITAGNTGTAFAINATTGQLTVATPAALDFETTPSFALTVRVTDNGTPVLNTSNTVTVNLTNVNEAPSTPIDANPAANTVAENAANGTLVGITASATDPEGTVLTYSLTDDAGGRFAIKANTGVVTVANGLLLNYEANTSHSITVRASDGALFSFQSFTIQVTDVPNAAYLSSTTEQITRGVAAGALNQAILRIPVVMNGNTDEPLSATSFTLTTTGTTTPADVAVARIYYTGTSGTFATSTLFGSLAAPGTGSLSIGGTQELQPGTNYFWLAYDVAPAAATGHLLDGTLPSLTIGGTARTPTVTSPAGVRPVVAPGRVVGTALRFSGAATGYVDFGTGNPNLVLGPQFTQEVWVKPNAASSSTLNGVLGYDPGSSSQRSPYISVSDNNRVEAGFGTGSSLVSITSSNNTLTSGQWNQLVSTYNGTTLALYVNGDLIQSQAVGTPPGTTPVRYVGTLSSTALSFFNGDVDEVAQWNRALSQNEIRLRRHLLLSGSEDNLASYVQFNEASGNATDPISGATGPLTGTGVTRVASSVPVSTGVSALQSVTGNGSVSFPGTRAAINFTGVSGSFDITVARLDGRPQGTQPTGMVNYYNAAYWIINKYGTGSFGNAAVTYTLSATDISPADASAAAAKLRLLKRASSSDGAFDVPIAATTANAAAGTVQYNLTSFSQTVIGTLGTSPLPVELTDFTVTLHGPAVALAWRTASEKNSARFEVERSTNGTAFDRIGTMAAAGSTSAPRTYALTDAQLPGVALLYYRLRQVDLDGTASYSPVRAVALSGVVPLAQLLAYPNPAHDAVRVVITGAEAPAPLQLFDAVGRLVWSQSFPANGPETTLPLTGLPTGVYLLRSGLLTQRLILQ